MFSCKDVRLFQSLPKWPKQLRQEGRAKAEDVLSYLNPVLANAQNPQHFVTGWLEGGLEEERSLASELGKSGKFIVVKPYVNS